MADTERALRAELDALAKKKEAISTPRGTGRYVEITSNRKNIFARLGGRDGARGDDRAGGKRAHDRDQGGRERFGGNSNKRQRLHSAVARPENDREKDKEGAGSPAGQDEEVKEQQKRRAVAPYAQKDGLARSRRMFGALMGHLGKAKAMIEKDSSLIKKQTSKQQEAEQKEKEQSKVLEVRAKREASISKFEKLIARAEVDMQEQLARTKLQHLQQARKGASLSRFLLTVSSPPIYYLPKKHTKETEDLVAASVEAHEEKMTTSTRDHESKLREIEAEFKAKIEKYREQLEEAKKEEDAEKDEAKSEHRDAATKQDRTEKEENDSKEEMSDAESVANEPVSPPAKGEIQNSSASPASPRSPVRSPVKEKAPPSSRKRRASGDDSNSFETSTSKRSRVDDTVPEPSTTQNESTTETPSEAAPSAKVTEPEDAKTETSESKPSTSTDAEVLSTPVKQKTDYNKMKVTELREVLKKRGLDTKGLKANLIKRLEEAADE